MQIEHCIHILGSTRRDLVRKSAFLSARTAMASSLSTAR